MEKLFKRIKVTIFPKTMQYFPTYRLFFSNIYINLPNSLYYKFYYYFIILTSS